MSFGATSSKNSSESKANSFYDPALTGLLTQRAQGANDFVNNSPYQPYSGQPLTYQPQSYGASTINPSSVPQVSAGQLATTDLKPYQNPYDQSVIDTTVNDLTRQKGILDAGAQAQATQAGAFGGSRSAVLQSLGDSDWQRNLMGTVAGLHQQGFNQAQGAAGQDIATRLAADQGNQSAGLNIANTNAGLLTGANAANAGAANTAGQFNSGVNWQQYLNAQNYPILLQQLLNQSYGLLPSSPLQTSTSTGSGSSFGFSASIPAPK